MKITNSRIVSFGELDIISLRRAFSEIPFEQLKVTAQRIRENMDWYGENYDRKTIYDAVMYVIRITEPNFDTEFIPAK